MPLNLAITTSSLGPRLDVALDAAGRSAATGVMFDARTELRAESLGETGRRQFLKQLDERGLRVAGLAFPTRRSLYDEADLDARIDALRTAMQFAAQLRGPVLSIRAGRIPEAETPERDLLVDVLDDLARYGNRVGTLLALQPMNDAPETLLELCDSVSAGLVGVDLDPAAFVFGGHDPTMAARVLHERLLHVRLRDGVRDLDSSGVEVPVGRGEVEWLPLLATLEEIGYDRWYTADRRSGDDRAGDAVRGLQYVQAVLPG